MAELMTDLARVVMEIDRLQFTNDDPMRHSKRVAKEVAGNILRNALTEASRVLDLASNIDYDLQALEKERAQPAQAGADRAGG